MQSIILTVESVKGSCSAGFQVGHQIKVTDTLVVPLESAPLCIYALSAMFPYLTAACRHTPQSDWINSVKQLQCPDCENTVIFSLKRI